MTAVEVLAYALCFAAFLAFYAYLHRRAQRAGQQPQIQWGWLAAIIGCALVAVLANAVL